MSNNLHIHMNESFQDGVDYALQYLKEVAETQRKNKGKLKDFIKTVELVQLERRNKKA